MNPPINRYEYKGFNKQSLLKAKGGRKVFVVFSTFGEREADLVQGKIRQLSGGLSDYIDGIILSHRRTGTGEDETERRARAEWKGVSVLVCNDYPVPDMGDEQGKGADMRRALHYINTGRKGDAAVADVVVVFLDADVAPEFFGPHFVLALSGAVLAGNDFARASFWRALGRVKKFVAQPLFSVIDHPDLRNLAGFHYPLSGEAAGTLEFFNAVHFWQRYGVETGINIDACMGRFRIADVNLGRYDHQHREEPDIQKMAFGIIRTYLMQLRDYGIISFSDNAAISDTLGFSSIDDQEVRRHYEFKLDEKKYPPLKDIL